MGATASRAQRSVPAPAPIFYTEEFIREYGTAGPCSGGSRGDSGESAAAVPAQPPPASDREMMAAERSRIIAELREQELSAAEAAAKRIGTWAAQRQSRTVPCLAEQAQVERCYASPPGGDQLACAAAVDAFAQCARL
mmetsp:Transcript_74991/g.160591  ORF Transcript_74991/g.160591 Transcript_74991/m.160591 type:complete len:138 (-) Transcript_74991:146-559(-)